MKIPRQSLEYVDSVLHFGQKKLSDFTANYNGPQYIYNLSLIEERYKMMQSALSPSRIFYAMKANSNIEVLKKLKKLGSGVDVVSLGEIQRAIQAGFGTEDIIYSGVGKTKKEILESVRLGIYQINVESLPELLRIGEIARSFNKRVMIVLRLNPDVDINTHPYIATGLRDNKFGIELNLLPEIKNVLRDNPYLHLVGISLHLGSQMQEFQSFREALQKLKPVYMDLKRDFPSVDRLDYGGGLGINYENFDWDKEIDSLSSYSQVVKQELTSLNCKLQTEPGRWLVARAGILLCQVQYVKVTSHKKFLILDSGMNHLARPSLYQSYHRIWSLNETDKKETYDVVGPICESADFFAKERLMSKVNEGDFIVVADTGAYGFSMATGYNLQPLPQEKVI